MPATIFDKEAAIAAVALRFDEGAETWTLLAVGTLDECREACKRARSKGSEESLRVHLIDEVFGCETF